jgi:fructokinase
MELLGGIESGGTKFVCVVGSAPDQIIAEKRIPTTSPDETIQRVIEFFKPYTFRNELAAAGIASFGPLDLNVASKTYGYITTTPKPGWSQVDLYGEIERGLRVPVAFDTDVNAAAFGEQYWNNQKRNLDPFIYMTVGTGIGVGVIINGAPLHGLIHAEAGHFALPHDRAKDPFDGVCPYHGDCLEGLASGKSMAIRWGQSPETLPLDHPAWDLEAEYIAFALVNLIYAYSPRRIIVGGGVAQHPGMVEAARTKVQNILNGYIQSDMVLENIEEYIQLPSLGNRSGALGAMAMARKLVSDSLPRVEQKFHS